MIRLEPAVDEGARLRVAASADTLERRDGRPFFWLGDTAWLINQKLAPREAEEYLNNRAAKGFTVVQVMALHTTAARNAAGDPALPGGPAALAVARGLEGGYWDTLEALVVAAAVRGLYVALVPVWGTVVQEGALNLDQAVAYTRLLARRFRRHPNVVWLNGGDVRGSVHREVWEAMGATLKREDPGHLVTFHPFGRTRSAQWFHNAPWLDFNMVQSGHRTYDQRTPETEVPGEDVWHGEDNWRYLLEDRDLAPRRPTLDGEPSYEDIPHGLHDPAQPRWTAADCRRYAWWALLAGAFGHTYGHNSVMQFHRAGDEPVFDARREWRECLDDPGARQMTWVRAFALALGGGPLVPDDSVLASPGGQRYQRLRAARSGGVQVAYTYCGGDVSLARVPSGAAVWWFDPRTGTSVNVGTAAGGSLLSRAPGGSQPGNDWLLVVDPTDEVQARILSFGFE